MRRPHHRATALLLALAALFAAGSAPAAMLQPGAAFPAWSLPDQRGTTVTSADLAGKRYLLWFYPKAMTPGCTAEGHALRDRYADFLKAGVAVFGVSFDSPADNARFASEEGFPFALLSDAQRTLAVQVGAADSPTQPLARRVSYLVGADGKVLAAYDNVTPATHAGQVLSDLPQTAPR